jgi:thiamine biosynthesis lipoprotein
MTRFEADSLEYFDTATKLIGYAETQEEFEKDADFVFKEIKTYHQLFDIYNDYEGINNIKTINDNAGIAPVQVDQKLIDMLLFSKEIHDLTDGSVNIAFGSVLGIWHDYREQAINSPGDAKVPPMADLVAASQYTDISKLIIDEQAGTVYLEDRNMRLDVGAIAKGYAVEQVADDSQKIAGIDSLLISLGGNVRSIGVKDAKGTPWSVGVQDPQEEAGTAILHSLNLVDKSMVTSGDYQRYYILDGVRYHHIIDPRTLMPADHFRSVTVVVEDSGLADGLSTGAFILPLDEAKALIEKVAGAEAVFVLPDGSLEYTDGYKDYLNNL